MLFRLVNLSEQVFHDNFFLLKGWLSTKDIVLSHRLSFLSKYSQRTVQFRLRSGEERSAALERVEKICSFDFRFDDTFSNY